VSLSYPPIVIYVGSEFEPGSCAYREILAHEMRHLKAYVDYLPKVESRVRETLGRRFAAKPVYAARGQSLARVQARTRRALDALHQARDGQGRRAAGGHRQFRRIRASQQSLPG
jgi:hypothetical protein